MFETDKFKSIYACKKEFAPAVVIEEVCDDGSIVETLKIEKKATKGSKYLPGERLLLTLNKNKYKHKQKSKQSIDINKITNSVQNLLQIF